jgi:hypothetical protein
MLKNPLKGMLTALRGPKTDGPMAPEKQPGYAKEDNAFPSISGIPVRVEIVDKNA